MSARLPAWRGDTIEPRSRARGVSAKYLLAGERQRLTK